MNKVKMQKQMTLTGFVKVARVESRRILPSAAGEKEHGIIIVRGLRFPKNQEFHEIWGFGDCGIEEGRKIATQFPHLKERTEEVKGCPPLDWWREQAIEKELGAKVWM